MLRFSGFSPGDEGRPEAGFESGRAQPGVVVCRVLGQQGPGEETLLVQQSGYIPVTGRWAKPMWLPANAASGGSSGDLRRRPESAKP